MPVYGSRLSGTKRVSPPEFADLPEAERPWFELRTFSAVQRGKVIDSMLGMVVGDDGEKEMTVSTPGTGQVTAVRFGVCNFGNLFDPETDNPYECKTVGGGDNERLHEHSLLFISRWWNWLFDQVSDYNKIDKETEGNSPSPPKSGQDEPPSTTANASPSGSPAPTAGGEESSQGPRSAHDVEVVVE